MVEQLEATLSRVKRQTRLLVTEIGMDRAVGITGLSSSSLRRYYSVSADALHSLMPVDAVIRLERAAGRAHVTEAIAEGSGRRVTQGDDPSQKSGCLNGDVLRLAQKFGRLMSQYYLSIEDQKITADEASLLLKDTAALQGILLDMKRNLEQEF